MLLLAAPAKCVQCQQISRVLMGVVSGANRGYVLAHCGGGAGGQQVHVQKAFHQITTTRLSCFNT